MANMDEIRRLFDQQNRIEITYSDMRTEVTPRVVRLIDDAHGRAMLLYSQLDESSADETIREEITYCKRLGIANEFEWKVYDYDPPADLKERLITQGFVPDEREAALILDLQATPPALLAPVTHDVRRITDPAGLVELAGVYGQDWYEDSGWFIDSLATVLRETPDEMSLYIAYVDGIPASSARMELPPNNDFGGLWGGQTLPQYRKRGLYTALVAVRAQEAIQRGKRYLTIDASPMSRVVLEKFGFQFMAYTTPFNYRG
ncbi:MAG: N-acetyltransferase [Chloroflexota bacterium]